ncbi:MAG: LptF/LptG family permease [Kiritimatiellae bacterium]|nr:LptF/LptG family permease [Kiritimatiellia bacterium]
MKLIDKYLLRTLLLPLMYCLAAFVLIYVIYDLFDNLSDFVQAGTPALAVAKFYMLLIPSVLVLIVPISLLLAVLYSLSSLTKNNELTAMRASGVSLYRLITPFVAVGFAASVVVALIHETVGPWSAYWTYQFVRSQRHKGADISVYVATHLAYKNEAARRIWLLGEFDTRTYDMKNIEVIQQREDGSDRSKVQAKRGQWLDGRWWFTELASQEYDQQGGPIGPPQTTRRREMIEFMETPVDFINEIKDPAYLSSYDIARYLRVHRHLSRDTIARIRVDLHHRLAMPWTCLIVTLIGVPFGVTTGRKGALLGVALSLLLFFAFYVLINVGLALGKQETIEPWLGAWGPNLLFLAIGLAFVNRMRH